MIGTEMVRPSSRSTDRVSSVTVTEMALGNVRVTTAEIIPFNSQFLQVFLGYSFDISQLFPAIAIILGQGHIGIEPEFGAHCLSVDVYVAWLITIV